MTAFALGGLMSGAVHAVSGPDHLLSLAPLSVGRRRAAWRVGLVWGAGHALGTTAAAALLAALVTVTALPLAGAWGERAAGLALVALGVVGLLRRRTEAAEPDAPPAGSALGVLAVGVVHGVTGAAGLLLLAPAITAGSLAQGITYLAGFSVGSAAAMAALTASLAAAARLTRAGPVPLRLARLASAGSVALGLAWVALSV
ncbi:MAG: hypothetical protein QM767_07045 [Anaeromyxobacter sp.]